MFATRVLRHLKMLMLLLTTVVLMAFGCKRWYPLMFDHAVSTVHHVFELTITKLYTMHWGVWVAVVAAIVASSLKKMLKKSTVSKKRVPKRSAHARFFDTYCRRRKRT